MLTGLLFQLPGLVIMTLVGVGAASFLKTPAPWLRGATAGLGAAGVALVAASAFALTRGACRGDGLLLSLSAASAVVTFYTVKIWLFPVLILAGGLVTLAVNAYRRKDMAAKTSGDDEAHVERFGLPRAAGALVVVLWAAVLVATLVAASKVPDFPMSKSSLGLDLWSAMFRAGSMIFGGEFFPPNVFPPMFFRLVGAEAFFSFLISFFLRLSKKKKKKQAVRSSSLYFTKTSSSATATLRSALPNASILPTPGSRARTSTWASRSCKASRFLFIIFFPPFLSPFALSLHFFSLFLSHFFFFSLSSPSPSPSLPSKKKRNKRDSSSPGTALQLRSLPGRRRRRRILGQERQPQRRPRRLSRVARPQLPGNPPLLRPAAVVGELQALSGLQEDAPGAQRRRGGARDLGGDLARDLPEGCEPVPERDRVHRDGRLRGHRGAESSRSARGARGRRSGGGRLGGRDELREKEERGNEERGENDAEFRGNKTRKRFFFLFGAGAFHIVSFTRSWTRH